MVMHIFGLRWKAEAQQADKERALAEIRAFPGQIPGILALTAGTNVSERSQGYETVGVMQFASRDALAAYLTHPVHEAFVAWIGPLIEAVDLDVEVG